MFLGKLTNITHTLAFRLTLWYTMIFILSSLGAFALLYLSISNAIDKNMDADLLAELNEVSTLSQMQGMDGIKSLSYAETESEGVEKVFCRLVDSRGKELFSTNMSSWRRYRCWQKCVESACKRRRSCL